MNKKKQVLQKGLYKHYKGNYYIVIDTAIHSETEEEMVLYKPQKNDGFWVRPLNMFLETVEFNGELINRFQFIKPLD